jgi:hypothetical protein
MNIRHVTGASLGSPQISRGGERIGVVFPQYPRIGVIGTLEKLLGTLSVTKRGQRASKVIRGGECIGVVFPQYPRIGVIGTLEKLLGTLSVTPDHEDGCQVSCNGGVFA